MMLAEDVAVILEERMARLGNECLCLRQVALRVEEKESGPERERDGSARSRVDHVHVLDAVAPGLGEVIVAALIKVVYRQTIIFIYSTLPVRASQKIIDYGFFPERGVFLRGQPPLINKVVQTLRISDGCAELAGRVQVFEPGYDDADDALQPPALLVADCGGDGINLQENLVAVPRR